MKINPISVNRYVPEIQGCTKQGQEVDLRNISILPLTAASVHKYSSSKSIKVSVDVECHKWGYGGVEIRFPDPKKCEGKELVFEVVAKFDEGSENPGILCEMINKNGTKCDVAELDRSPEGWRRYIVYYKDDNSNMKGFMVKFHGDVRGWMKIQHIRVRTSG